MRLDLEPGIERDAYGQPLSPTHLLTANKPFAGPKAGDGADANAGAMQQAHSNLASQGFPG